MKQSSKQQKATTAASDFGSLGNAQKSRVVIFEQIAAENPRRGHERQERLRYRDSSLLDRMHLAGQLSERQYDAAVKFLGMWEDASLQPRQVANYGERSGASISASEDPDEPTPRDLYRRFTRKFVHLRLSLLEGVLMEQHPGANNMDELRDVLDQLADFWRL